MAENGKTRGRKDRIIDAALRIFAEKGFPNATISEISREAGCSEATISEYFGTKEDLLFAIPEKISNESIEETDRALSYIRGAEGRLRALLLAYVRLYQSNPHYAALVLLQLMNNKRFRKTPAHAAIRRSAHRLLDCIRQGIADGTFKKDCNPYLIRSMLLGTIEHLFIQRHMQAEPQRQSDITELLDPFIEIVLGGIRTASADKGVTLYLRREDARTLGELLRAPEGQTQD